MKCGECRYKEGLRPEERAGVPLGQGPHGRCVRFPPTRTRLVVGLDKLGRPEFQDESGWPLISDHQWCGEFVLKTMSAS